MVQLFGHFLTYLDEQIRGNGIDISTLKWGAETKRLAPAPVVVALKAAGLPLSLESPTAPAPPAAAPEQAAPPPPPVRSPTSHIRISADSDRWLYRFYSSAPIAKSTRTTRPGSTHPSFG